MAGEQLTDGAGATDGAEVDRPTAESVSPSTVTSLTVIVGGGLQLMTFAVTFMVVLSSIEPRVPRLRFLRGQARDR